MSTRAALGCPAVSLAAQSLVRQAQAHVPLRLAQAGEHAGPELGLWARNGDFRALSLYAGKCTPFGDEMVNGLVVDASLTTSRRGASPMRR
jgi:hypothetical protein